jgi:zona occludens toxin (predicted ATPase)
MTDALANSATPGFFFRNKNLWKSRRPYFLIGLFFWSIYKVYYFVQNFNHFQKP